MNASSSGRESASAGTMYPPSSGPDKLSGGLFGGGRLDKVVTAYTFLIFNYEI